MKKLVRLSKYFAAAVCFGLVAMLSVWAQKPSAEVEAELIKIQNDWATARIKRDVPFLEKLYAKEFNIIALDGNLVTREADIANFASGDLKPEIVRDEEMKVSVYGDTAIVTGIEHLKGTYKNIPGEFTLRFTNVYVRRDNRWQMVRHQSTEIRSSKKSQSQ